MKRPPRPPNARPKLKGVSVKVLVLVLSMEKAPFVELEATQRVTWAGDDVPCAPVSFYSGRVSGSAYWFARGLIWCARVAPPGRSRLLRRFGAHTWNLREDGVQWRLSIPDLWALINAKTVAVFRHALGAHDFDYVFRTNSSSYVDRAALLRWVHGLPRSKCYAGSVHEWEGISVVSGSGVLLSRDLVRACVDDPSWNFGVMDDVAIAQSMRSRGIEPIHHPRIDACEPADLEAEVLQGIFHVRCKNRQDRTDDVRTMLRARVLFNQASPL